MRATKAPAPSWNEQTVAQVLIEHPEDLDDVITRIANDVRSDKNVNKPFAVFKSRLRLIERSMLAAGGSGKRVEEFFQESLAIYARLNPRYTRVRKYDRNNVVERVNGMHQ